MLHQYAIRSAIVGAILLSGTTAAADGPQNVEPVEPKPAVVEALPLPDTVTDEPAVVVEEKPTKPRGPLGPEWDCDEYLLWWLKPQSIPPMLIGGPGQAVPLFNQPNTTLLIGGELRSQDHSGARFVGGWSLDSDETIGIELSYFFLGSRSLTQAFASPGAAGDRNLARPYLSPIDDSRQSFSVAQIGWSSGRLEMVASSRVQGAEANAMSYLGGGSQFRFDGIIGFRFLQVNEGIRIGQRTNETWGYPIADLPAAVVNGGPIQNAVYSSSVTDIVDQIDGHNIFYGGQIGIRSDWKRGPVFVETIGKVAFGQTNEVVKINGVQVVTIDGVATSGPTGFYGQQSISGRFTQSVFAVMPELTIRTGCQYKSSRWFVGYNFLYLSRLARPGDQIDERLFPPSRTFGLNESLVPTIYPQLHFTQSDFWAQGITIGAEMRY